MTKPDYVLAHKAKTVLTALRDRDEGHQRALLARLGQFFPHGAGFGWLEDENDTTLQACFTSEPGGWLEDVQDAEFWQLIVGIDTDQPEWVLPSALVPLLERVAAGWEGAGTAPAADQEADAGAQADPPRFTNVERVPGEGYAGWWQGYDTRDQVWKYVQSGDVRPDDRVAGWAAGDVAFAGPVASAAAGPSAQAADAPRFTNVERVPGGDYPGWWQGYDTLDQRWEYAYSTGEQPGDQVLGWSAGDLATAAAEREAAIRALHQEAMAQRPDLERIPEQRRLEMVAAVVYERWQLTGRWSG